ncbi:class I SAM-dependent methyltransferase [Taibaiella soli]|uniref:Class I SAM-dependent methyltransferase n=1 Tax=Taibaiella soli TaxID=1649169 RepID=A0A2W2BTE3_9BACT|nr:class I SAM-dependent methyltransferase [Taibaiella soli]PZF71053.1 class I SAM-dependent methyltransferase [Taibaiella soli]
MEKSIKEIYYNHKGFLVNKWNHYLDIYDRHFLPYQGKDVKFLEIGISQGGSLEMWKQYFGAGSMFYAMDIIPECKMFERENVKIFIGSQGDPQYLNSILGDIPPLDILLDDGGHFVKDQIVTFNLLWDKVKDGGLYVCEDLHTSYWYSYGGGYMRKGTFIEFVKHLMDVMHAWHSKQPAKFKLEKLTEQIKAIHVYESMVVIEKAKVSQPKQSKFGEKQIPDQIPAKRGFFDLATGKIRKAWMGFKN